MHDKCINEECLNYQTLQRVSSRFTLQEMKERKRKAKGWRWKSYKCFLQYRRKNEEMYGQAIIFMTQIKYNNGIPCLLSDKFEFVKNIKGMLCFFGVADLCENPITPT